MVDVEQGTLGLEAITVTDDGDGIPYADAPVLFGNLGGSWKRLSRRSKSKKRILHGEEGKGRFRALALGRVVDWIVTTPLAGRLQRFTISILRDNPRRVTIGECPSSEFLGQGRLKIRESLAPLVCNIMRLADGAASGDWRLSVV